MKIPPPFRTPILRGFFFMLVPIINCQGEIDERQIGKEVGDCAQFYCQAHFALEIFFRIPMAIRNSTCKQRAIVSVYLSEKFGDQRRLTREHIVDELLNRNPGNAVWIWTYAKREFEGI
jgi:hypothetical protein